MRHRFFTNSEIVPGTAITLSHDEQHHANVVRVRDGEEVEVVNGRGAGFVARYSADGVQITGLAPNREARVALHLAMAIINLDKFDLVLQKATELGVRSIIPLVTERVEVRAERYRGKADRWKKIVFEAVKQSGRSVIPLVEEPAELAAVMQRLGPKIVFDADTEATAWEPAQNATLFIGPEGGWSEDELRLARESGSAFARLGVRRLRAETAAIVATALVTARSHDI